MEEIVYFFVDLYREAFMVKLRYWGYLISHLQTCLDGEARRRNLIKKITFAPLRFHIQSISALKSKLNLRLQSISALKSKVNLI